jgi:transcriptional regulator with XRE-family HTH domain
VARNERSAAVIGRVLRAARERCGLTQQELALRAGMDRAYVNEVENGKRSLSVDRMLRLCAVIGVRPGIIINRIADALKPNR